MTDTHVRHLFTESGPRYFIDYDSWKKAVMNAFGYDELAFNKHAVVNTSSGVVTVVGTMPTSSFFMYAKWDGQRGRVPG